MRQGKTIHVAMPLQQHENELLSFLSHTSLQSEILHTPDDEYIRIFAGLTPEVAAKGLLDGTITIPGEPGDGPEDDLP